MRCAACRLASSRVSFESPSHLLLRPMPLALILRWHLGQRDIYLPTSRGFDRYLGIPFSQDIGTSFWACDGNIPRDGAYCNSRAAQPYQPVPLPLLNDSSPNAGHVLEQPANLFTIAEKYAAEAVNFVTRNAAAATPFLLYFPFNHIHSPQSCGARWCGQSTRGPVGDATEEVDGMVGAVMAALKASAAAQDTLVFFT